MTRVMGDVQMQCNPFAIRRAQITDVGKINKTDAVQTPVGAVGNRAYQWTIGN